MARSASDESVMTLIKMLTDQGYEADAFMLEKAVRSVATSTSDKIVQILEILELLSQKEETLPPESREQLQKTMFELRNLLEQANNPWPWRFVKNVRKSFEKYFSF